MSEEKAPRSPPHGSSGPTQRRNPATPNALIEQAFEWLPKSPLQSLGVVVAALAIPAALYLTYDLVQQEISPCDSIFRQTEVNLAAKIGFLKADGAIHLGRTKVAELSDRAQMTALNLKTCCTALDHGRLNPEQFLSCKAKSRAYDDRISELVALVKSALPAAQAAAGRTPSSNTATRLPAIAAAASATTPEKALATLKPAERKKRIEQTAAAASKISQELNATVVQVAKSEALRTLEITPPKNVKISGQESEPNSSLIATNAITMGETITAAISEAKDADFYVFKTPPTHRDWITIKLQNRSTTLDPRFDIYNGQKQHMTSRYSGTAGADLEYSLVAQPETTFILRVGTYHGKSTGQYLLTALPTKSYDEFEPNQNLLTATKANLGSPIKAKLMDGKDVDMFVFDTSGVAKDSKISVSIENRSTTLHPRAYIYNAAKSNVTSPYNGTAGGDLRHTLKGNMGGKLYVAVHDYHGSGHGAYTLTVTQGK